jgi:hypothetical protein
MANSFIKISVLHLYITIFPSRNFVKVCYGFMALTGAYCLAVILEALLLCRPLAFNWDKTIPDGVCGDNQLGFLVTGILNMIIDVFVVSLPMPMLWGLQMPTAKKVAISGIFGIGYAYVSLSWQSLMLCC